MFALCLTFAFACGAAVAADAPKSASTPGPSAQGAAAPGASAQGSAAPAPAAQGAAPASARELIEKRKAARREAAKKAGEIPPIDVNSAKKTELKKLQGVDDALADRIIAGRPYQTKAELVTKVGMPMGVYQQNRKQIIARPPAKAKGAAKQNPKK